MKRHQVQLPTLAVVSQLPNIARTRAGNEFDPTLSRWKIRGDVDVLNINFDALPPVSPILMFGFKSALLWCAEKNSLGTVSGMFQHIQRLLRHMSKATAMPLEIITSSDFLNFKTHLKPEAEWYASHVAGYLRSWHSLGYPGLDDDLMSTLRQLRLKGNPKGNAVRTMDPNGGPFTDIELQTIQASLDHAYEHGQVGVQDYLIAWLFIMLGPRPVQLAALKLGDIVAERKPDGSVEYILRVPRAKQGHAHIRKELKERPLIPQIWTSPTPVDISDL